MKLENNNSDDAVLTEFGHRITRLRLDRNQTQSELAASAGVSLRTLGRMEAGQSIQFNSVVRILRALELLDKLEMLFPSGAPSPIEQWKAHGKVRRRASRGDSESSSEKSSPAKPWTWGADE